MSKYNGWTNYETWRVNLEIFDGFDREICGLDLTNGKRTILGISSRVTRRS